MKQIIFSLLAASVLLAACNNEKKKDAGDKNETSMSSGESKQERNKKIVWASTEAVGKKDIDAVVKDAAPVFTDYNDGSMPPVTNLDSLKGFLTMLTTSIEGYRAENPMLFADGDNVIVYADWTGTFKNDLMGIKATGKPVKFKDVDIFKLNEDGKITEHRSVQNIGAVLMASGMMK